VAAEDLAVVPDFSFEGVVFFFVDAALLSVSSGAVSVLRKPAAAGT
jgi:hypothetical protein